jgi:predicted DNA-binding transcriptional regulator YafY
MGDEMAAIRGTLTLLRTLSKGPASKQQLLAILEGAGIFRDERTVRRWLAVLREEGFGIPRKEGRYELQSAPVRVALADREALVTLSVLDSLADREPVYGDHFASAAAKLREAIPPHAVRFADRGGIEFDLDFASVPPEDPKVMDTLREAAHQHRHAEILYHSLNSNTVRRRILQPVRVFHAQRAHRLDAYDPERGGIREFRVNRIKNARMLPGKFAPEAHRHHREPVKVRLSMNAFVAYGRSIIPDDQASIERHDDGGATITGTTPSPFWTTRDIAALGPEAEVLGSPKLKSDLLTFLRETLAKYE